ncbi:MAG: MBL fold metallo-hydrolase [Candidatus Abyssobacteria bacterium SURF_17]|uniref:MBL fold metallo-hydrolase n=1 Tax=Candidatus Abyssobacteria bacterium SURF_17 TaxID=2093361 RepID=A0A419F960_9BACT|nr:MAG: MBL fold metallo-hydrolase [Candidatus Abyssubacteria bacterium SURF_17]
MRVSQENLTHTGYRTVEVAKHIHQIPTPTPFYVGAINTYLIEDEPLTLVDSGLKTEEAEEALRAGLKELGFAFSDIEQIIITHSHLDHYGLMATIASEGNPRVCAHPLEVFDLQNPRGYANEDDERYHRTERFLLKSGLPKELLENILMRHPIFEQLRDPITVTQMVNDGDVIRLKHRELRVVHCPGHSPGLINLYDSAARVLLSGDNLLKHISPVPLINFPKDSSQPRAHSLADYLATLRRLKTLDVDIVLTGHGEIIHDMNEIIDSIVVHHEVRKRKVHRFLDGSPKTAYDVCSHLFPKIEAYHIYLGMSEAVGHLDILQTEGAVEMEERNGKFLYHSKGAPRH